MYLRQIEELSMNAWAALQTRLYDGWVLRFANGYTKRANSVSPIYESTIGLDEKIDFCEKQYSLCNLPTTFKLTDGSNPTGIDQRLAERGYVKIDETSVRILDLGKFDCCKPQNVFIEDHFTDKWINGFYKCEGLINTKDRLSARMILDNILGKVICVSVQIDGEVAGCGFGAVEREYVGIFDIIVGKGYRGRGYGLSIMNGILSEAARMGIAKAYLSVVVGNSPAENLYDKLGFFEVYRYWYRKLPE